MSEELRKDFATLGVHDVEVESLTVEQAKAAYRKAALITHPDKADPAFPKQVADFTAAFQELGNCYERVLKHIVEKLQAQDDNFEPSTDAALFAKDNFNKFNFPFENKGSFTVQVEDVLADIWQECLEIVYGVPRIVMNGGTESDRMWKTMYSLNDQQIELTIHFYNHNKPNAKKQSKILVQGGIQFLICEYVFCELPIIYKMVSLRKPPSGPLLRNSKRKLGTPVKRRNMKHKPTVKPETINCAMCEFTSVSNVKIIRHMKTTHTEPKMLDEDMSVSEVSIAEELNGTGFEKLLVESKSCNKCDFVFTGEDALEMHVDELHGNNTVITVNEVVSPTPQVKPLPLYKCNECAYATITTNALKDHKIEAHGKEQLSKVYEEMFLHSCISCDYRTNEYKNLVGHGADIHGNKQKGNNELKANISVEPSPILINLVQCDECEFVTNGEESLDVHAQTHNLTPKGDENITVNNDAIIEEPQITTSLLNTERSPTNIICPFCNLESRNLDGLKSHIENNHISKDVKEANQDTIQVKDSETVVKCPNCAFISTECELEKHLQSNHGKINACDLCVNMILRMKLH